MSEIKNKLDSGSLSKRVKVIIETKTIMFGSSRTEHLLKMCIELRLGDDDKI